MQSPTYALVGLSRIYALAERGYDSLETHAFDGIDVAADLIEHTVSLSCPGSVCRTCSLSKGSVHLLVYDLGYGSDLSSV